MEDTLQHAVSETKTDADLFNRLRQLDRSLMDGGNKHDRVHVLILACLAEGLNTRIRIVRAIVHLGYTSSHVAIVLNTGEGSNPERHSWKRDKAGHYVALV